MIAFFSLESLTKCSSFSHIRLLPIRARHRSISAAKRAGSSSRHVARILSSERVVASASRGQGQRAGGRDASHFCNKLLPPKGLDTRMSCRARAMSFDPPRRKACRTRKYGKAAWRALSFAKVAPEEGFPTSFSKRVSAKLQTNFVSHEVLQRGRKSGELTRNEVSR